jgi:WD40 repeat protein
MELLYLDTEADSLGSKAGIETGTTASGAKAGAAVTFLAKKGEYLGGTYSSALAKPLLGEAPGCTIEWTSLDTTRLLGNFHAGSINSLSLSSQTSHMVTASAADESLRVVDFANSTGPCFAVADFRGERRAETANYVDMHPSGNHFAAACEDEALELVMADTGLETVRRIPTKVPHTLPNGTPFVNMHPVSIVKYSHTGHLLAVVTHKLAQIFHMYDYDVNASDCSLKPTLVMALMEHTAPITDIIFSCDDKVIYTSAADGTIYSWELGAEKRHADYMNKSLPATKIVTDDTGFLVAAYTPDLVALKEEARARSALTGSLRSGSVVPPPPVDTTPSRGSRRGSVTSTPPGSRGRRPSATGLGGLSRPMSSSSSSSSMFYGKLEEEGGVKDDYYDDKTKISPQSVLVYWTSDAIDLDYRSATVVNVDGGILSMALGRLDSANRDRVCCLGLHDGCVLVSLLPFPTHIINVATPAPMFTPGTASTGAHSGLPGGSSMPNLDQKWAASASSLPGANGSPLLSTNRRTLNSRVTSPDMNQTAGVAAVNAAAGGGTSDYGATTGGATGGIDGVDAASETLDDGTTAAAPYSASLREKKSYLCEEKCRILQLHSRGVTAVSFSISGLWIFSAGEDGVIYMIATSVRARDLSDVPENSRSLQNNYVITEKEALTSMRARMSEVDQILKDKSRESDRIINKLIEENAVKVAQLETRMKREMEKRDEIIIKTREDMIRTSKNLNKQLTELREGQVREMSELESEYEKRLSKENLYLHKMRQAYDEFVLHARMDMQDFEKEVEKRREGDHHLHIEDLKKQEQQKEGLLAYIEYVKARNQEIISALDGSQSEERQRQKIALEEASRATEHAAQKGLSEIAQLTIEVQKGKHAIGKKEDELMRMSSDIGWANERIKKLETALSESATNLQRQTETAQKWEYRCGEQSQLVHDLERIRKALTSQLHGLRQEVGPEKEKLSQVSDRLQEVDREYELSLHSISEKEGEIIHRGNNITLLQKQVRDLRNTTSQKERALIRAAKVLGEYKFALKEAEFNTVKRTVPEDSMGAGSGTMHLSASVPNLKNALAADGREGNNDGDDSKSQTSGRGHDHPAAVSALASSNAGGGNGKGKNKGKTGAAGTGSELVEVIRRSENMNSSLRRLEEILMPFESGGGVGEIDDETTQALMERERHVLQLHQQVHTLKSSLNNTEETAMIKVKKSLGENLMLLEEVNQMRHRIKKMNQDNQRQKATIDMLHIRMSQAGVDAGKGVGGRTGINESLSGSLHDGTMMMMDGDANINSPHTLGGVKQVGYSNTVSVPSIGKIGAGGASLQLYARDPNDLAFRGAGSQASSEEMYGRAGSGDITLSGYLLAEQSVEGTNNADARNSTNGSVDNYVPPYSSGDPTPETGGGLEGERSGNTMRQPQRLVPPKQQQHKSDALASVNRTSAAASAAIKNNKTQNKTSTGSAVIGNEDSIASLKTADEKIAAIMAENDQKIKEMRDQSSAHEILSYYQHKLSDVEVPPRSAGRNSSNPTPSTSKRGAGERRGGTASKPSSSSRSNTGGASDEEKNGGATGSSSVYRPLGKGNTTALKQGVLNATVQLPEIKHTASGSAGGV